MVVGCIGCSGAPRQREAKLGSGWGRFASMLHFKELSHLDSACQLTDISSEVRGPRRKGHNLSA